MALLASADGRVVGEGRAGGANLRVHGELAVEKALDEAIDQALGGLDVRPSAVCLGIAGVDRDLEDAARVDGADGFALFRRVTLPLSGRALAAGLVLCWARALGEFGATILFAGSLQGRTQTMPLLIYGAIERDIDGALWIGLVLIALALAALLASQWLAPREQH